MSASDKPFMRVELTGPEWDAVIGAIGEARVMLNRDYLAGVVSRDKHRDKHARLDAVAAKLSDREAMVVDGVL